jgi:hypothetical protein
LLTRDEATRGEHRQAAGIGAQAKELNFRKQRSPVLEAQHGAAIFRQFQPVAIKANV